MKKELSLSTTIKQDLKSTWHYWTDPDHIPKWNFASESWHCPWAKVDCRVGGKFLFRMESKDKSEGFDFTGHYERIEPFKTLQCILDDTRKCKVTFVSTDSETTLITQQQQGWAAILRHFKLYAEEYAKTPKGACM